MSKYLSCNIELKPAFLRTRRKPLLPRFYTHTDNIALSWRRLAPICQRTKANFKLEINSDMVRQQESRETYFHDWKNNMVCNKEAGRRVVSRWGITSNRTRVLSLSPGEGEQAQLKVEVVERSGSVVRAPSLAEQIRGAPAPPSVLKGRRRRRRDAPEAAAVNSISELARWGRSMLYACNSQKTNLTSKCHTWLKHNKTHNLKACEPFICFSSTVD